MSVLRLLSPSRVPSERKPGSSINPSKNDKITVDVQLLTNGTVLMDAPDDPLWPHAISDGPREDQLLNGGLDIHVPRGIKRRRVKSVRMGIRTKCRLNLGGKRGWEEDIVFERKVEMLAGNSDGILLDEGIQRFEFTLILPSTLAPHDWYPNGSITQELFAELEGQPEHVTSTYNIFGFGSKRSSRTPSRSPSPTSHNPSRHPRSRSISPTLPSFDSMTITRQADSTPVVPTYTESQADSVINGGIDEEEWVNGVLESSRSIQITHNPNPTGNFSDLDQRQHGFAEGLGPWELKIMSDVFSVGGPVHVRLTLAEPSPKTTIYSWTAQLKQLHVITSPRDEPAAPVSTTTFFEISTFGTRPPRGAGSDRPALWRGLQAGGMSSGQFKSEGNGYLPKHHGARPTTLPGIITPIKVSHSLVSEIYFSVWGEDERGIELSIPGPGGLRFLRIEKPVILPSCSLIPARLDVPDYHNISTEEECPACGRRFNAQMCTSCAPSFVPHIRHDSINARDQVDYCEACWKRFEPVLDPYEVEMCACLLDRRDVETRMARFWEDDSSSEIVQNAAKR